MKKTRIHILMAALVVTTLLPAASANGVDLRFGDPVQFGEVSILDGSDWLYLEPGDESFTVNVVFPSESTVSEEIVTKSYTSVDSVVGFHSPQQGTKTERTLDGEVTAKLTLAGGMSWFSLRGSDIRIEGEDGLLHAGGAGTCSFDFGGPGGSHFGLYGRPAPCLDDGGLLAAFHEGTQITVHANATDYMAWRGADVQCTSEECVPGGYWQDEQVEPSSGTYLHQATWSNVHWTGAPTSLSLLGSSSVAYAGSQQLDLTARNFVRLPHVDQLGCDDCDGPEQQLLTIDGTTTLSDVQRQGDGTLSGQAYSPTGTVFFDEQETEWSALQTGGAVAAAGAVAASALGLLGIKVLAPLLTKGSEKEMLKHPRRDQVFAYIKENPGATFRELMRATDIPAGSLRHHINVLERSDIIVEHDHNATKRFFEDHGKYHETWHAVVLLREEPLKELHDWLDGNPESPQKKILAAFDARGWSRSTVQNRLKRLEKEGLVSVTPRGRLKSYSTVDPRTTVPNR